MNNENSNSPSESRYLLNFSFSHKRLTNENFNEGLFSSTGFNSSKSCMSSNVISETSLEEDYMILRKKSLLKRKSMGSLKIFYSEIIDLRLNKSDLSSLYSSIEIVYSKNGYSKHLIRLSSSDGFAVRWFYDELVVRYSFIKSNLKDFDKFKSNENQWLNENNLDDDAVVSKDIDDSNKLDDFMNQMNKELSPKKKRKLSKQMKFDRCSTGEY